MVERQIHWLLVLAPTPAVSPSASRRLVRSTAAATTTTRAAAAPESARGAVDARIVIAVHRDQSVPFVLVRRSLSTRPIEWHLLQSSWVPLSPV